MRRSIAPWAAFVLAALVAALPAFALDVDRAEIESAGIEGVVFVNYEGPQSRIDSLADIKGIGSSLGASIAGGAASSGGADRYRVLRAVDPSVAQGFDADIIFIGSAAGVDHVRNLRWVIAGYLQAAWRYSEKDAYLIATFATFYNALHRGDMAFFNAKYKKVVTAQLSPANAGLSTRYSEWPGKSAIVIPLSSGAKAGSLSAVDTGAVAGKDVVASLQAEEGKGIPERQAMTDLKEREAAALRADAEKQRAEILRSEADIAAEKARLEAERAKLAADKAAATAAADRAAADKAAATTAAEKAAADAAAKEAAATAAAAELKEKEVAAAEAAVAEKETAVADRKEDAAATEAAAKAKEAEAAEERKAITSDQKEIIAEEVAAKGQAEAKGVYLLQVMDSLNPFARVVYVNAETGEVIRSSRINSIRGKSVLDAGDWFVAVAGREGGGAAVRLVRLDKTSLEVVAESKTDVFTDSGVWKVGDSYYAVVKAGSLIEYRFARFDAELAEKARSADTVNPLTFMSEAAGGLVVQNSANVFMVLKPDGLEKIKELKP